VPKLLVSPGNLQNTMLHIQNNMPVMTSAVQNSDSSSNAGVVVSPQVSSTLSANQLVERVSHVNAK